MQKIRVLTPGEILLTEFIRPKNLTVYRVAKESGIPQPTLQMIVRSKRGITTETAVKLGDYFGVDAQFWLNLQSEYDLRVSAGQKSLAGERGMNAFGNVQSKLENLIATPRDLPTVYLFGDVGSGKTCLVRQLLGTADQNFPSVRRLRTTVAPTEYIITNEPELRAAFVLKSEDEVEHYVTEIFERALADCIDVGAEPETRFNLADLLAESPDQRFRLRCFITEQSRTALAEEMRCGILPQIQLWIERTFQNEPDNSVITEKALKEFAMQIGELRSKVMRSIRSRVLEVCRLPAGQGYPDSYSFAEHDRTAFLSRLKEFLGSDEGSISPVVEKARVRGCLKSPIIEPALQLVVTDSEGIGHDAKESKILSARHLDYFYANDAIVLVEDSETPFTRGGQSALAAIVSSGHLPKLTLAFSRLDKVQCDKDDRPSQIREVNQNLRNVLNALRDDGIQFSRDALRVRYFAQMNADPDAATKSEIKELLVEIVGKHREGKTKFVRPRYDFELLAGHLTRATGELRESWQGQVRGSEAAKWQTQKAFTKRMDRKEEEFRFLKPIAEFTELLIKAIDPFLANPQSWDQEISDLHKSHCLQRLKQEVSNHILQHVRSVLLEREHSKWNEAANIAGPGTTRDRSSIILEAISSSAPQITDQEIKDFKDAVKQLIISALTICAHDDTGNGVCGNEGT